MKFIIEDDERDIISQFFMSAYPDEVSREFIYVQGDGNLVEKVKYLLSSTDEMLLVLIDMIPDNTNTVRIYRNLRTLSRQNNGRIIVLPIVCAEYYLVTSLVNTGVIIDETGVDICINKDFWHNSLLTQTSHINFSYAP